MDVSLILWIVVAALGITFAVKPLWMWIFTESWKNDSTEPQEGYLRYARTFGIILAAVGVGMLVLTLAV